MTGVEEHAKISELNWDSEYDDRYDEADITEEYLRSETKLVCVYSIV